MQNMQNDSVAPAPEAGEASTPGQMRVRFIPGRVRVDVLRLTDSDVVTPPTERKALKSQASLLELSSHEAELSVTSPMEIGEALILTVVDEQLDLDVHLFAEVRVSQPAGNQTTLIRCVFYPELPSHVLSQLPGASHMDRRSGSRCDVRLPVSRVQSAW